MSLNINEVTIAGNICSDLEIRQAGSSQVLNFSVATNERWTDKSGQKQEKAEFHNCQVWGKQAENVSTYVSKGKLVAVRGSLQTRNYENKEGITVYITEILADRVEFLEWGEKSKNETKKSSNGEDYDFSDFKSVEDEDVPF